MTYTCSRTRTTISMRTPKPTRTPMRTPEAEADVDVDALVGCRETWVGVLAEVGRVCRLPWPGDEYAAGPLGVGWGCALVDGAGLAGEVALGEADGEVDAKPSGFADPDAGAVAGDVGAARACSIWTGGLLMEFTTKAVAPPAPTMPPRISASTSGFVRRRRGGLGPRRGRGRGRG